MPTYTNEAFNYPARFPRSTEDLFVQETSRAYANGDIVKGPYVKKGTKITGSTFAARAELDTNAAPTATAKVRLNNGSTQVNLISITAAQLGTANGVVVHATEPAGINKLIEDDGYWVELVFDAAFATAAAGVVAFGVTVTPNLWGGEQTTVET